MQSTNKKFIRSFVVIRGVRILLEVDVSNANVIKTMEIIENFFDPSMAEYTWETAKLALEVLYGAATVADTFSKSFSEAEYLWCQIQCLEKWEEIIESATKQLIMATNKLAEEATQHRLKILKQLVENKKHEISEFMKDHCKFEVGSEEKILSIMITVAGVKWLLEVKKDENTTDTSSCETIIGIVESIKQSELSNDVKKLVNGACDKLSIMFQNKTNKEPLKCFMKTRHEELISKYGLNVNEMRREADQGWSYLLDKLAMGDSTKMAKEMEEKQKKIVQWISEKFTGEGKEEKK